MLTINPYTDKTRHRFLYGLLLSALCLLLLPSCSEEEDTLAGTTDIKPALCKATLRLNVSTFSHDTFGPRAYVQGVDDENRIKDIWVFQYEAKTGRCLKSNPAYLDDFDSNDIDVLLTFNTNGEESLVCIVANTHDATWALNEHGTIKETLDTYDKLRESVIPSNVSDAFLSGSMGEVGGYTIPMFGVSKPLAIVSESYVSVPLTRLFARLDVSIDVTSYHQLGMEIEKLRFFNIPYYSCLGVLNESKGDETPAKYPSDVQWKDFDAGKVESCVLYVPENLQGKVLEMVSKQSATTGFPDNALGVELTMSYGENKSKQHVYTVYPGLDMTNDFNVKRNHIYKVNISIRNLPE